MNPEIQLAFHHLGVATRQPQQACKFLETLGYEAGAEVFDPLQVVNLSLFSASNLPNVELVSPTGNPSPLDSIFSRTDVAPYHYCFETMGIESTVVQWRASGSRVICVSPPKPAVLFDGRKVGFYMASGFGLIELLETTS